MRFDLHSRTGVRERLDHLAQQMAAWDEPPRLEDQEIHQLRESVHSFGHAELVGDFVLGGVDGSGDYPALSYGDSFVYVTVAQATRYRSDASVGLREEAGPAPGIVEFTWIPEDEEQRPAAIDEAFERLAGTDLATIVERSDYRVLKAARTGKQSSVGELVSELIRPHAADAGNLAIQLRSSAELSAALRLMQGGGALRYLLYDSTLSLPFVGRHGASLFHEHLKRLCCVEARQRQSGFFALSKSHGLPAMELLERVAAEKLGIAAGGVGEHWYLRIPTESRDGWRFSLVEHRNVPPPGAVTYLVRFHKNVPVLRLDMDEGYWTAYVKGGASEETTANEERIFRELDHASHDQRCYGYPYPIKASHDRASLTAPERVALRKMIIDAAVAAGMRRSLFRTASAATGHE